MIPGSPTHRLPSKEEIRAEAESGIFDDNPLFTAPHEVECNSCGFRIGVIFLDYLKSGRFEIRKTEMVEVFHAAPTLSGLGLSQERITPLVITIECTRCGKENFHSPISLEYLLLIKNRKKTPQIFLV